MSESTSCNERARALLDSVRRGDCWPRESVYALGEECPTAFFRTVVESLADSFEPAEAEAYTQLMRAWDLEAPSITPTVPGRVDTVFVLSRVTLGADIKITSAILDCVKRRFPNARIVLVANRKSAELFAADERIEHCEANYPRSGQVSTRLEFAHELRRMLAGPHRIVIDPDSRMTQLGLIPVCEPERCFHFPSRAIGKDSPANLTELTTRWLEETFGEKGRAYVAVPPIHIGRESPCAAVSLGVGDNKSKRMEGNFEPRLIRLLGERYATVWIDRGAGGEEAQRVTAAVEASGVQDRVRFWEGSFAGFVSVIAQSALYAGYDSGGQHAAAAAGTPLISIFKGALSDRFRNRWKPQGEASITVIDSDSLDAEECLRLIARSSTDRDDSGRGQPPARYQS